jgi:opacity protein-like surface antigen
MQHHISSAIALGLAVALSFAATETAQAQSTTGGTRVTSSQRIPIRKGAPTTAEASGAVEPTPNADSIAFADSVAAVERARQDSLLAAQRAMQDSLAAVERARQDSIAQVELAMRMRNDSIARADSIAAAEAAARAKLPRAMYFNIAGGASMPTGVLNDLFKTGFNATASLGWNPPSMPIGLRIDGGYDRLMGRDVTILGSTVALDDASIWSGLAELTLGIPLTIARLSPYIVGGGGVYHFTNYNTDASSSDDSMTKGGWNAGGGVTFSFGRTNLFLESRYMSISTPGDAATFVPIVLGLTFR